MEDLVSVNLVSQSINVAYKTPFITICIGYLAIMCTLNQTDASKTLRRSQERRKGQD